MGLGLVKSASLAVTRDTPLDRRGHWKKQYDKSGHRLAHSRISYTPLTRQNREAIRAGQVDLAPPITLRIRRPRAAEGPQSLLMQATYSKKVPRKFGIRIIAPRVNKGFGRAASNINTCGAAGQGETIEYEGWVVEDEQVGNGEEGEESFSYGR